jgi:hypothetical protein
MKTTKKTLKIPHKKMSVAASIKKEPEYEKDFVKWTKSQANLLKKRNLDELDIDNLIEEIESLGKNDRRALYSQTLILLTHLLKLEYQPKGQGNSNSWNSSILNATREIKRLIKDSPSLRNELIKIFPEAYEDARQSASVETQLNIKTFPKDCPWNIQKILPFIKIR